MRRKSQIIFAAMAMLLLIFDTKTVQAGILDGIDICLKTVIPSIFPFMVVCSFLNAAISGKKVASLSFLERILRIPSGSGMHFLIGILGGYPIGAQSIAASVRNKRLSGMDGARMLAFCSNAGPAFIFGIGFTLLPNTFLCFLVWAIHILCAMLTGLLTPGAATSPISAENKEEMTLAQCLTVSVRALSIICGWIILFRALNNVMDRWVLWFVPEPLRILIHGTLELANGACSLMLLEPIGLRLILFCALLAFGGLCITMQTRSVCDGVNMRRYLPGKLTQAALSILLSQSIQPALEPQERYYLHPGILAVCCGLIMLYPMLGSSVKIGGSNFARSSV